MSDLNDFRIIFLQEAERLVDDLEETLLIFDKGDYSAEQVDRLFRIVHTFKGSSQSVKFDQLSKFAHQVEEVLAAIRGGKIIPNKETGTLLFHCSDVFKQYVIGLNDDFNFVIDTSKIENTLLEYLRSFGVSSHIDQKEPESKEIIFMTEDKEKNFTQPPIQAPSQLSSPETRESPVHAVVAPKEVFIRVSLSKLDTLLNLVGELVVNQSVLNNHKIQGTTNSIQALDTIGYLEKIVTSIKSNSISLRMVDIKPLFLKMHRNIRDLAIDLKRSRLLHRR